MPVEIVKRARGALNKLTPLSGDCGKRCLTACCRQYDGDSAGMYLYPGELELYSTVPSWAEIEQTPKAPILYCNGTCDRDERPLSCRIFPLIPAIIDYDPDTQPNWEQAAAIMDRRAFAVCPLAESGVKKLSPEFVRAVKEVALILSQNEKTLSFMQAQYEAQLEAEDFFS